MADLRLHPGCMHAFLQHLREREGVVNHFYCDSRGLVTIAVGYLVDRGQGGRQRGLSIARTLANRADVHFANKEDGSPATQEEVLADWRRAKDFGFRVRRARAYGEVTQLRIDDPSIDAITTTVVNKFADELYRKRPFVLRHDARVAMALVDARYNPAGVRIYGNRMLAFWNALNPNDRDFDVQRAIELFDQAWAGSRVMERNSYRKRHQQRLQWLREGLVGGCENEALVERAAFAANGAITQVRGE